MSNSFVRKLNISGSYIIDIPTLLTDYIGINDEKLIKRLKTHKDVREEALEGVRYLPFPYVSREAILRGEILMVKDSHNHEAPCENPQIGRTLNLIRK